MSLLSSILLGLIQGVAEFLPISSSGHLAIAEHLLGMSGASDIPEFFDVLLHLGTLLAVFAAVYLDGGIGEASALIHRLLLDAEKEEAVEERRRDYKTALQELVQRQAGQELSYRMAGEQGPDHAKTFAAEVLLNGTVVGTGSGHSKKEAEQSAAKAALAAMGET